MGSLVNYGSRYSISYCALGGWGEAGLMPVRAANGKGWEASGRNNQRLKLTRSARSACNLTAGR